MFKCSTDRLQRKQTESHWRKRKRRNNIRDRGLGTVRESLPQAVLTSFIPFPTLIKRRSRCRPSFTYLISHTLPIGYCCCDAQVKERLPLPPWEKVSFGCWCHHRDLITGQIFFCCNLWELTLTLYLHFYYYFLHRPSVCSSCWGLCPYSCRGNRRHSCPWRAPKTSSRPTTSSTSVSLTLF